MGTFADGVVVTLLFEAWLYLMVMLVRGALEMYRIHEDGPR